MNLRAIHSLRMLEITSKLYQLLYWWLQSQLVRPLCGGQTFPSNFDFTLTLHRLYIVITSEIF